MSTNTRDEYWNNDLDSDENLKPAYAEKVARSLRLVVIRQQFETGNLTEDEAIELLRGPLSPGDETTIRDDSRLLKVSLSEIRDAGLIA